MVLSRAKKAIVAAGATAVLAFGLPASAQASATVCDLAPYSGQLNVCESIDGGGMTVYHLQADWHDGGPYQDFHFEITGPWGHWFNSPGLRTDQFGLGTYTWYWNPGTTFPEAGYYCTIAWAWDYMAGNWRNYGEACINVHP